MNFFNVLLTTIKSKVTPIWTKVKLWTNISFIKSRILTKVRSFFSKTLSVKPRNKKDYYPMFGWLVSKKLAYAIVLGIGVASLYYLTFINPISVFRGDGDAIRTYSYRSIPLRFTEGQVKIKAKSGYIAYEGNVEKGVVEGNGTLYNKDHEVVYTGAFASNKYNGTGKEYYKGEILKYSGTFQNNLFEGEGSLYRTNGTKEYDGAFSLGMKEGQGTLYGTSSQEVYNGNFSKDQLVYSDLLGKKTTEVADCYTGDRTVYTDDQYFVVHMKDIQAIYAGAIGTDTLDGTVSVDSVYVLGNQIYINGKTCKNITDLNEAFGEPIYDGNSAVIMPEAVAVKILNEEGNTSFDQIDMSTTDTFQDAITVDDFDSDYLIYLYSYRYENLIYTFFTKEKYGAFGMYQIEKDATEEQSQ